MIKPKCERCKKELKKFGAILLGPPFEEEMGSTVVEKFHLCIKCYNKLLKVMLELE